MKVLLAIIAIIIVIEALALALDKPYHRQSDWYKDWIKDLYNQDGK